MACVWTVSVLVARDRLRRGGAAGTGPAETALRGRVFAERRLMVEATSSMANGKVIGSPSFRVGWIM